MGNDMAMQKWAHWTQIRNKSCNLQRIINRFTHILRR